MNWNHILNWELLSGSHNFPGPDGGTCINEAAIVAAGFKYKIVKSADDCPPCFSKVISSYLIGLNDSMPHDLRQELLMPFVVRLSGTADSADIEEIRIQYIITEIVKKILPNVLNKVGLFHVANSCAMIKDFKEASTITHAAAHAARAAYAVAARADAVYAAGAAARAADAARTAYAAYAAAARAATRDAAITYAVNAVAYAAGAGRADAGVWKIASDIAMEAILLGNHPEEKDVELVVRRMNQAKLEHV